MPRHRKAIRNCDQLLHITNRGVDRSTIFYRPEEYRLFLDLLFDNMNLDNIRILVYTLMPNHFHLLLWQRLGYGVSTFMHDVCGEYAQIINRRFGRTGHLFQDRYRADPIDFPDSMLRLSWYIHQNPVGAKLVTSPEDWEFGSMRDYAGQTSPRIASTQLIIDLVGSRENYLAFMEEYDPEDPGSVWGYLA